MIVRDDLIGQRCRGTPSVFDYKVQADNDSMLNTPPTYSIYIAGLVFQWLKQQGGLAEMEKINIAKAKLLYDYPRREQVLSATRSRRKTARA